MPISENDLSELQHTLRNLKKPDKLKQSRWMRSALVKATRRQQPQLTDSQALHAAFTAVLLQMETQHPHYTDLLRGRFWEGLTVAEMVRRERPQSQSQRRFYAQQKQALLHFAPLLLAHERAYQQDRIAQKLLRALPAPTYTQAFGLDTIADQVLHYLQAEDEHHIVSVQGIGGIGKTTLADYVVRRYVEEQPTLHGLIWISAKQEHLSPFGITGATTGVRLEQLFDELAYRLGVKTAARLPLAQKMIKLNSALRDQSHLVVIDNLETVTEFETLVPRLEQLAAPSKFLLTSREVVPALSAVTNVPLTELNREASLQLIQHMAQAKQVDDVDAARVYALVGGNPLAIQLVVSQMQCLPAAVVLDGVRTGSTEEMYTFIYRKSWSALSDAARRVLFAIQRAGDQADWAWLQMVLDLSHQDQAQALRQLWNLSLLQHHHHRARHVYAIHRLTSTFLRTEVLGWK